MRQHSIVQTEELNYTMMETRKEHISLAFATSERISEELILNRGLLQECAEVITVQKLLQHVQLGQLFQVLCQYSIL